jgi:membrane-associated protease RseP (regulator of RpoE activity)
VTAGIIVVVGIILMVMIHEGGHFFAAKATGMKATEFFFGFGPKLWSTKRGETEYGVKAIPFGGYVRIVGMNLYEEVDPADEGRTYRERPFWQKSVVVLAGVASHFLVAFLLFFVVLTAFGVVELTTEVSQVSETVEIEEDVILPSPASVAGLQEGDTIVSFDGVPVGEWDELAGMIADRPGETVVIGVERDGRLIDVEAELAALDGDGTGKRGYLGISPGREEVRVGPLRGLVRAAGEVGSATVVSVQGLWQLISGFGDLVGATLTGNTDDIAENRPASPIGIVGIAADIGDIGFTLELLALVNVFVGIFNVIPIYPLDGGHFAVAAYERIRGRPADVRKLAPVAAAVVVFMVLLGLLAVYLDITDPLRLR